MGTKEQIVRLLESRACPYSGGPEVRVVDGGWWLGSYWLQCDFGVTVAQYPTLWFDDALSALEFLGKSRIPEAKP